MFVIYIIDVASDLDLKNDLQKHPLIDNTLFEPMPT